LGLGVWGLRFGIWGLGFGNWVAGFGFRVSGLGFRFLVSGLGFRIWGFRSRVWGFGPLDDLGLGRDDYRVEPNLPRVRVYGSGFRDNNRGNSRGMNFGV
jgi:hypothetical protein